MTKYIAEFSTGDVITRNSKCNYSHAYRVTSPSGGIYGQGFSARHDLAEKAARSSGPNRFTKRDLRYPHLAAYYKKMATDKGFQSVEAFFADHNAYVDQWWLDAKVELVEVMWS